MGVQKKDKPLKDLQKKRGEPPRKGIPKDHATTSPLREEKINFK